MGFRIGKADVKNELSVEPEEDSSQIDGFRKELINFLFPSDEHVNDDSEEREIMGLSLMESFNDFSEDYIKESEEDDGTKTSISEKNIDEKEDFSASMSEREQKELDVNSEFRDERVYKVVEEEEEEKEETGMTALMEVKEIKREEEEEEVEEEEEEETESSVLISNKFEFVSGRDIIGFVEEPTTTMTFSFREFFVGPHVSDTQIFEHKSQEEKSDRVQSFQEFHPYSNESQVEIKQLQSEKDPVFHEEIQEETSKVKPEEVNSIEEQSFQEFHPSPNGYELKISEVKSEEEPVFEEELQRDSAQEQSMLSFHASPNVSETEISETKSEEEKEGSILEMRILHGHSSSDRFSLKSEIFRGGDSSDDDEDDLDFIDNSLESDSESESSSSSGLIWGNSDKTDDLISYDFFSYQKDFQGLVEPETLKLMEKLRAIDEFIDFSPMKDEKEEDKKKLRELEYVDEEEEDDDEDDLEWDDDELVQQMKMEMKNARQGGLPTILEDDEEGQEVSESPKLAEDLKPLKIEEEKMEFKDHMREIQKVHKCYQEKMRKLDILNYQTMHALGNNLN